MFEIIRYILPDHNRIRLEIGKSLYRKSPSIWKLNKKLLNNPWVKVVITRHLRKHFALNENGNTLQNFGKSNPAMYKNDSIS